MVKILDVLNGSAIKYHGGGISWEWGVLPRRGEVKYVHTSTTHMFI